MNKNFNDTLHKYGRIFTIMGIIVMFLAPVLSWIITGVSPNWVKVAAGVGGLWIFIIGGFIEMMTYSPLLGTSATYLAFVTGNLINLKVPCAMNAAELCGTKINTEENEIVSTISVAFSSITTVTILGLGVLMLIPLTPLLESPILAPAFNWVVHALFGAMGYKYFKGNPKIVIAPMTFVIVLSIFLSDFVIGNASTLVFVAALVSLGFAKLLFDKEMI